MSTSRALKRKCRPTSEHPGNVSSGYHSRVREYPEDGDSVCQRVFGFLPKPEQREVAKSIGRDEDAILIVGCGWGKTLAYFLPLVLWEDRIVVIISPLVALMEDQHLKLEAVGVQSIIVRGHGDNDCMSAEIEKQLLNGYFKAVFVSTETIFNNAQFISFWGDGMWRSKVQAAVIDEAHCIVSWGQEFRTDYSKIGQLRNLIPPDVAFVAVSATLPGQVLQDIKRSLSFSNDVMVIRADTDRPNIKYVVQVEVENIERCYKALEMCLDDKKTIVYFDNKDEMRKAFETLLQAIMNNPESLSSLTKCSSSTQPYQTLESLHTWRHSSKARFPNSLTVLAQRLGRAARDPKLQGEGILLYSKIAESAKIGTLEEHLMRFVTFSTCRTMYLNEVFENQHKTVPNCCDICDILRSTPYTMPDYRTIRKRPGPSLSRNFTTSRTVAQRLEAQRLIMEWRLNEYQIMAKESEIYTENNIMNERRIKQLVTKFGDVAISTDITAILDGWTPVSSGALERLTFVLINYNGVLDGQK
ncbi:hypothetical protein BG004_000310 [Podila humilis]|nr:hypothetical protein BG004_000310 [Podila humilis]